MATLSHSSIAFFPKLSTILRSAPRHLAIRSAATLVSPSFTTAMKAKALVKSVKARQIIDSRGNPTVEVDLMIGDDALYRSVVPSGVSTGIYEALEMRDGDTSVYGGKGVLNAVRNVNEVLGVEFG